MSDAKPPRDEKPPKKAPDSPISDSQGPTAAGPSGGVVAPGAGKRLGDFEIVSELGRGGMGIVFEARQISLNRPVALKLLPPGLGMTEDSVRRFEREAQTAAKLHHTNIVPVYAIGSEEGSYFYAMELIEGQPMSDILKELRGGQASPLMEKTVAQTGGARPPGESAKGTTEETTTSSISSSMTETSSGGGSRVWFDTVARLLAEVAEALQYAHGRGVIHRDIKPGNLMLASDGRLCITDFGLARVAQEPGMTVTGSFMGTPAYMSPEQIAAGRIKVDHRSDVYSLGAVLYEMLTFHRPFPGESRDEILTGIMTREPQGPRKVNPRVPMDLETICLKAMEKDPARRYQSAGEFANDLRQFLSHGLITARRASAARRAVRFVQRNPVPVTIGAAAVILVVGILGVTQILSAQKATESALRGVSDARYYLSQGEYAKGLEAIEATLRLSPDLDEARVLKAHLLVKLDRTSEAVAEAQEVLDQNPRDWKAHLVMAMAASSQTSFSPQLSIDAKEHLKVVEEEAPETADAYYVRALVADTPKEALALLDKALSLDPAHTDALRERVYRYEDLKNYPAALEDAERLALLKPRSARGRQLVGWIHAQRYANQEALDAYAKAIEIDPDDPITYRRRAQVYSDLGRYEESHADMIKAVELQPDYAPSLVGRAWSNMMLGNYEQSIADARRALELDPTTGEAYWPLYWSTRASGDVEALPGLMEEGKASVVAFSNAKAKAELYRGMVEGYLDVGNTAAAMATADSAILLDPENPLGYVTRALVKQSLGDGEGRDADCKRCAELPLDEPEKLRERAVYLHRACGRRDLAIRDLTRAIEIAPAWPQPYNNRAYLYRRERRWDDAIADYTAAIELTPTWGAMYNNRAIIYSRKGDEEAALADYRRCLEVGEDHTIIRRNIALTLVELGRLSEALAEIDHVEKLRPEINMADRYRGEMSYLAGEAEEAMTHFDAAVGKQPDEFQAHLDRAKLLVVLKGDCGRALADLEKGISLATPTDTDALRKASMMYSTFLAAHCPDAANPALALEKAMAALNQDRTSEASMVVAGAALYASGKHAEAAEMLERAAEVSERPPSSQLLFSLAMCYQQLGQKQWALSTYQRGLAQLARRLPKDPDRLFFRDQAARLLGVKGAEKALAPTS